MIPGIYDISNDDYHNSTGVSRSAIMEFMRTPLHYWDKYINPNKPDKSSSEACDFGEALHTYILEPNKFENKYLFFDKKDGRSKEGKKYNIESKLLAESTNRKLLNLQDYLKIKDIFERIQKNYEVIECIRGAQYEKSIYWTDHDTGILCKSRPDILFTNMVCDIKTTISADINSFSYSIRDYGYHIQCAMIADGIKAIFGKDIVDFIFILLEKERPYAVATYPLAEDALTEGRRVYKENLVRMKKCFETNVWPGYAIQEITLPHLINRRN